MFQVVILAGGLATRLRPITERLPKSLIKIDGTPFIFYQLDYLRKQNIKSVVLCVGYLGEMIKNVVGNGKNWGMQIDYSFDGEVLLGTGGSLKRALPLLGNDFFVMYGDSFLPINFSDVQNAYIASGKLGLMTVLKNRNQWDKSNVEFCNGKIIEYNKEKIRKQMQHIDFGLGLLHSSVLTRYPVNQKFDLSIVYNELSLAGNLAGFEMFERFYEIGSRQGIQDLKVYFLGKNIG